MEKPSWWEGTRERMYQALKVKRRSPVQGYSAAVAAAGCCHVTPVCDSPSPLRDDSSSVQAHAVRNTYITVLQM